jgi:7,8-dihydroneopterin aldolase/epimerase/oxygenase
MTVYKVKLTDVVFLAPHGLYPEEQILGNSFLVNTELSINISDAHKAKDEYLDYAKVYEIVSKIMNIATGTLEELAAKILTQYQEIFPTINEAQVSISKQNPLMGKQVGAAVVTLAKCYK